MSWVTLAGIVGIGMLILSVVGAYLGIGKVLRQGLDRLQDHLSARIDSLATQVTKLREEVAAIQASKVDENDCRERHDDLMLKVALKVAL